MRILLTNDDGINAPGLAVLEEIAAQVAGPKGEVWVVAPAFEQSGVAHSISYIHPTLIAQLGPRRFATEGTPADCVLAGLHEILADTPPDLVLSGVNRGNNSGENTMYSGTLGAAIEASLQGVPAIGLSQYLGPRTRDIDPFDAARTHGPALLQKLLRAATWRTDSDFNLFYSINFPPVPAAEVAGTRVAPVGVRAGTRFSVESQASPSGRRYLWVRGGRQDAPAAKGSDVDANMRGYISVTPMRPDLSAHDQLAPLREHLE